jgi:hypothetical protein
VTHATAVRVTQAHPLSPPWSTARRTRCSFMPPEKARTGEASQVPPSPPYPAKRAPPGLIEPLELVREISEQSGPHVDRPRACEPRTQQNGFADGLRLARVADGVSNLRKTRPESSRAEVQRARELASRYPIAAKPPLAPLKHENFPDRGTQRKPPAPSDLLAWSKPRSEPPSTGEIFNTAGVAEM